MANPQTTPRVLLQRSPPGQITRHLNRLRIHGIIKKVGKRTKYYLTDLGRQWAAMALKLHASE